MKLGIITINHNRPKIMRLWCAQIARLWRDLEIDFPVVVVSGEDDKGICGAYKIPHITWGNKPVTDKFNLCFSEMRKLGVDAVLIMGSDDNISTGFYRSTLKLIEEGYDLVGVRTMYFYAGDGQFRGRLLKLERPQQTKFLGIGKTVSKKLLDQCDWKLWGEPRNFGMDALADKTIFALNPAKAEVKEMIVDIKTNFNLNRINVWIPNGRPRLPQVDPNEFYKQLSEEELKLLRML